MNNWNDLSLKEKADVMKVAIGKGIYNLSDIRKTYNEYAGGGDIHIKPENRGKFTRLKERTGHSASWFKLHGTPAQKKMATFALNARKWKHGDGGPLIELAKEYENGGPQSDNSIPWYAKTSLWILDKIGLSNYTKGNDDDIKYRQNLYNRVDPTVEIPKTAEEAFWQFRNAVQAKNENNSEYRRDYEDAVANAGWAKRLGLPYDKNILIDNSDGSVRLPDYVENEIPTDTLFLKNRIATNEKLLERYKNLGGLSSERAELINNGLEYDKKMLDGLRKVYNNPGDSAVVNEHSFINRHWIENGEPSYKPSPLNILKNYTITYDKDNNELKYYDIYDFNEFEPFVPGNPYEIKGSIKLK